MKRSSGFTLTELLIVVAILALLMMLAFTNWKRQVERSIDAQRKSDLAQIKTTFENYFNDNGCYPPQTMMNDATDCESNQFEAWGLRALPCDPETKLPYDYQPVDGDPCSGYRTFADLSDTSDPIIAQLGCTGGCGPNGVYNYGISSGVPVGIVLTVTPTTAPDRWACTALNHCNSIGGGVVCVPDVTYSDGATCDANCTIPSQLVDCN